MLQNWRIPFEASYRPIDNGDSIQYVNEDESRILYFSMLMLTDSQVFSGDAMTKMQPSLTKSEDGWQLKGAKHGGKEVIICVFTFTNETDEAQMKNLFKNIEYIDS